LTGAWLTAVVAIGGLTASIMAASTVAAGARASDQRRFDSASREVAAAVNARVDGNVALLFVIRNVIAGNPALTRRQFRSLVADGGLLDLYPSALAIAFARHVPSDTDDDRLVVDLIEPMGEFASVFGFDLMSEPSRREAAVAARDRGDPVATAAITLADGGGRRGFLLLLATYDTPGVPVTSPARRRGYLGAVTVPHDAGDLLTTVLGPEPQVDLEVYDIGLTVASEPGTPTAANLLFDADADHAALHADGLSGLSSTIDINVADRRWRLFATPTVRFHRTGALLAWAIGGAGVAVTAALAGLVLTLARSTRRAETLAAAMTNELAGSEERFRSLAGTASDGIIGADGTGNIVYANRAAEAMFGYTAEELVGQPLTILMPSRFHDDHVAGLARYVATGVPRLMGTVLELAGRRHNGEEFPLELSLSTWRTDGTAFFTGILRDITDRKLAEETAQAVSARALLLATVGRAVAGADELPQAVAALGVTVRPAVDFSLASVAVHDHGQAFRVVDVVGADGSRVSDTQFMVVGDGLWSRLRAGRAARVDESGTSGADGASALLRHGMRSAVVVPVLAAGDIRALVNFSSTSRGAFDTDAVRILEAVVGEAAGTLNTLMALDRERAAANRLRQLDELKNEFVGMVAHDLRSPVGVISGSARMLRRDWAGLSATDRDELLGHIEVTVGRLSALIGDVLEVARIESGHVVYDLQPFDLAALVRRTVAEMTNTQPDRRVEIVTADQLPHALGDDERCWRVLTNLLANAFKFSPSSATVTVAVTAAGEELTVAITDHGVGIAPDDVDRLFQKFSRLAPRSEHIPPTGIGLGLYICKEIVAGHGGRIWVDSTVGVGSTFSFTIPIAPT